MGVVGSSKSQPLEGRGKKMAELKASLWYIGYSISINQKYNTNKICSTFLALRAAYFLLILHSKQGSSGQDY